MGFLKKLFGSEKHREEERKTPSPAAQAANIAAAAEQRLQTMAGEKERTTPVTDEELLKIFVTNFAPNKEFYSAPGSPKFQAYFGAVNAAQLEMLNNPALLKAATGRSAEELLDMVNHPKPGITSMLICGMIWCMGDYAVIKDRVLCVDFSEKIPNCVALYLLLTAERQPEGSRKQILDAGDGTDRKPLEKALSALKVCDPAWTPQIF